MGFFDSANARLTNGVLETLHTANASARRAVLRHKVYRATLQELNSLSDRDLSDLGIARCDIRRLAREAADLKVREFRAS